MRNPFFLSLLVSFILASIDLSVPRHSSGGVPTELDGDGVVGMSDLLIVLADFGTTCDVPPPRWACSRSPFYRVALQPCFCPRKRQ